MEEDFFTPLNETQKQELDFMKENIALKQQQKQFSKAMSPSNNNNNKFDFYSFSNDTPDMQYATLSDGQLVSRYKSYLPGVDNNERLAREQQTWDKWQNGLLKSGANLLTTVAGGTVGTIVGLAELAGGGSFYDNGFTNALADWNEKLRYQLPNYYTKQEQDLNFGQSLGSANFWANDVFGGLSFTLGIMVSEGIWAAATGGTSLAARAGMWAFKRAATWSKLSLGDDVLKGIANHKNIVQGGINKIFNTTSQEFAMEAGKLAYKFVDGANFVRFIATTSANEAGIESLHYKREQNENFLQHFKDVNGREPSPKEYAEFQENLNDSANAVFAANMAILAPSNLAMFGTTFGIKSPLRGLTKNINKNLFGTGAVKKTVKEGGQEVFDAVKASKKQMAARWTYASTKGLVTEGIWEEGLQGVATKTAENWLTSAFDPKYNNQTMSKMDAFYTAMHEQYTTKEGWKQMGIGMIIGSGMSLIQGGGKFQEIREFESQDKFNETYVAPGLTIFGGENSTASNLIAKRVMLDARVQEAMERQKDALEKGDDVKSALAANDILIADIQFRASIGEDLNNLISKYSASLDTITEKEYNDLGITDIASYKASVIQGYSELVNDYERASDFSNIVFGQSGILGTKIENQLLKDALTYSIIKGEKANVLADNILKEMSDVIGEENTRAIGIAKELQRLGANKQSQVRKINSDINKLEVERENLSAALLKLQQQELPKGQKLAEVQTKLNEVNDKHLKLVQEREELAQQVSQESKRRRTITKSDPNVANLQAEFISGQDLADIDKRLEKIEQTINDYQGSNPQVYYDLIDLLNQYKSAKNNFLEYNKTIEDILNNKFKPQYKVQGSFFQKAKDLDEFTKEYLERLANNYSEFQKNALTEQVMLNPEYFKDEAWDMKEAQGEIKNYIASKIRDRKVLTPKEKEYYNNYQFEINELAQPNPNKPNLSKQRDIITQLAEGVVNGNLTEEAQEAYDKSPQELKDLVQKTIAINMRRQDLAKRANELQKKLNSLKEAENNQNRKDLSKIKEDISKIEDELNELYKDVTIEQNIPNHELEVLKIEKKRLEDELATLEDLTETNSRVKEIEDRLKELNEGVSESVTNAPINQTDEISDLEQSTPIPQEQTAEQTIDPKIQEEINQLTEELNNIEETTTTENPRKKEIKKQLKDTNKRINEEFTQDLRAQIENSFDKDFILLKQDVDEMIKGIPTKEEQEIYKAYKSGQKIKRTEKTETEEYPQGDIKGTPYSIRGKKVYFNEEEIPNPEKKDIKELLKEHKLPTESKEEGKTLMTFNIEKFAFNKLIKLPAFRRLFTEEEIESFVVGENTMLIKDENVAEVKEKLAGVVVEESQKENPYLNKIEQLEKEKITNLKEVEEDVNIDEEQFEELETRMQKWFMAQSLPIGEVTMADLLTLMVQFETQTEAEDTLVEHSPELLFQEVEDPRTFRPDIDQTISGSAFVRFEKDNLHFSHLSAEWLANRIGGDVTISTVTYDKKTKVIKTQSKPKPATKELWEKLGKKENTVVQVGNVIFQIGSRGTLVMSKSDFNKIKEQANIIIVNNDTGSWSYSDLYEINLDGTTSKIDSVFKTNTQSELIYETQQGDILSYFVDMQTDFNSMLKNQILLEIEEKGEISEATKELVRSRLEITSRSPKGNLTTLKAADLSKQEDEFRLLRQRYADEFLKLFDKDTALSDLPSKIDIGVEIEISDYYLGTPILQLDEQGNVKDLPITDAGLTKVITQGYVEGDTIVLADKKIKTEEISRLYVKNIVDKNNTTKIPVVLLQKGKHKFVFPITMVKEFTDLTSKVEMIMQDQNSSPVQKIIQLNEVLIEANSSFRLDSFNSDSMERVLDELDQSFTTTTAAELAESSFDKNRLETEAQVKIDLEQGLISSPKLIISLPSMTIGDKESIDKSAINMRAEIVKDLAEIQKIITQIPNLNDTKLVQAFDNNVVENKGTDIMNRKDIKFIKEVLFDSNGNKLPLKGKTVDLIGKKELTDLRDKLEVLMSYEKQVKVKKDRETKNNIEC